MNLTRPQARALDALAHADAMGAQATVSNRTEVKEFGASVYWQSADSLVKKGLATSDPRHTPHGAITITDLGRDEHAARHDDT